MKLPLSEVIGPFLKPNLNKTRVACSLINFPYNYIYLYVYGVIGLAISINNIRKHLGVVPNDIRQGKETRDQFSDSMLLHDLQIVAASVATMQFACFLLACLTENPALFLPHLCGQLIAIISKVISSVLLMMNMNKQSLKKLMIKIPAVAVMTFNWCLGFCYFRQCLCICDLVMESALNESFNQGETFCEIPILDPFDPEITQFDSPPPNITCDGFDWVRCHQNHCQVRKDITDSYRNIVCTYKDIVHKNDSCYWLGKAQKVLGRGVYVLNVSDHVKVTCSGKRINEYCNDSSSMFFSKWKGHAIGFRPIVAASAGPSTASPGLDDLNILMLGFDSTSKSSFIRHMPLSYDMLTAELGAVVLNGYNIVGRGTKAAMFPLLFGWSSEEDCRLGNETDNGSPVVQLVNMLPNLFNIFKDRGYRTLYFEDTPWQPTFGKDAFDKQPADHYLRSFLLEETTRGVRWYHGGKEKYCVGDTPQYLLMMDKTKEFFEQDGKKFAFTFLADISHDDHNVISAADQDTADFLKWVKNSGLLENTLVIVFGDHGPSYTVARSIFIGRLEERLPLMSIMLPHTLKRDRPSAVSALARNTNVLTTPFDVHVTLLDAVGLKPAWNPKALGKRIPRGLSLLRPIPGSRSCWEAEVGPHWCACVRWENITDIDPLYHRAAEVLVKSINELISPHRKKCMFRSLASIQYVMRRRANKVIMSFKQGFSYENQIEHAAIFNELITVKVTATPGVAVYEATMVYRKLTDSFEIDWYAVQRTNA